MTIPKAESDLLIFLASSKVCPEAPVFPTFSEPARSTRYKLPVFCAPVSVLRCCMVIRNIEWDREDSAFISIEVPSETAQAFQIEILTRWCYYPCCAASSHDLIHLPCTAYIVIRQTLDVDTSRLFLVHLQIIVLGCKYVTSTQDSRKVNTHVKVSHGFSLDKFPCMTLWQGIQGEGRSLQSIGKFVQWSGVQFLSAHPSLYQPPVI